ncbi:hypothetical protein VCH24_31460 [Variovorax boronicumulans]|nr:hypothetical protein VCH24_31460 [Variovorax boronicumulans]
MPAVRAAVGTEQTPARGRQGVARRTHARQGIELAQHVDGGPQRTGCAALWEQQIEVNHRRDSWLKQHIDWLDQTLWQATGKPTIRRPFDPSCPVLPCPVMRCLP